MAEQFLTVVIEYDSITGGNWSGGGSLMLEGKGLRVKLWTHGTPCFFETPDKPIHSSPEHGCSPEKDAFPQPADSNWNECSTPGKGDKAVLEEDSRLLTIEERLTMLDEIRTMLGAH